MLGKNDIELFPNNIVFSPEIARIFPNNTGLSAEKARRGGPLSDLEREDAGLLLGVRGHVPALVAERAVARRHLARDAHTVGVQARRAGEAASVDRAGAVPALRDGYGRVDPALRSATQPRGSAGARCAATRGCRQQAVYNTTSRDLQRHHTAPIQFY